jgi:hypothetical protein
LGVNAVTAGQVIYGLNSSAIGNGTNLFFDPTNVRLGVGTNTPVATLYVKGGNSNNMVVDNAGQQFTTLSWYNNGTLRAQTYYDQTNALFVSGTDVAAAYVFKTNTVEAMRISAARGVSIGTSTDAGANNLLVNGTVTANSFGAVSATSVTATAGITASTLPFFINGLTVSANYTLPASVGAHSVGPITVNSGVTVTIPASSRWVIL